METCGSHISMLSRQLRMQSSSAMRSQVLMIFGPSVGIEKILTILEQIEADVAGRAELTNVLCTRQITLGATLLQCNQLAEAQEVLRKAIAIASHQNDKVTSTRAHVYLSMAMLQLGREDEAREMLLGLLHDASAEFVRGNNGECGCNSSLTPLRFSSTP
jgi:hypothetical protein